MSFNSLCILVAAMLLILSQLLNEGHATLNYSTYVAAQFVRGAKLSFIYKKMLTCISNKLCFVNHTTIFHREKLEKNTVVKTH